MKSEQSQKQRNNISQDIKLKRGRRKKVTHLGYSKDTVSDAVEEYLKNGGKITKVENTEVSDFIQKYNSTSSFSSKFTEGR